MERKGVLMKRKGVLIESKGMIMKRKEVPMKRKEVLIKGNVHVFWFECNLTVEYNKEGYMKFDTGVRSFILLSDSSLKFLVSNSKNFITCGF